jgi:DNA-directed RNA polymerase subunit RPC12/RpoP
MPVTEMTKYECRRCGERFELAVLTEREKRDAERERRPIIAIQCPRCHSQDLKRI